MPQPKPDKRVLAGRNLLSRAKAVSEVEARYIIAHAPESANEWAVIQHMDQWFDVRHMTNKALMDLIDDLDRAWSAELVAGVLNPH
jgi:hypothetical protein